MKVPECEKDGTCRFQFSPTYTTAMYFTPIYNDKGENTNPDRNTCRGDVTCLTHKRHWTFSYRVCDGMGSAEFIEITQKEG